MNLQRLKRILSEDKKEDKKWLSSYVNKASDKNLKDTFNMMKRSKDMSDDEFSRENARINRRNARIQKALPKVKLESFKEFISEAEIYKGDEVDTVYKGERLSTGSPVKLSYLRNKQKAGNFGSRFGQDIEPHGQYVTPIESETHRLAQEEPEKYETGTIHFKNPLVVKSDEDDPTVGWKKKLSAAYGGKKHHHLSKAIAKHGYDGIITTTKYGPSETVNLQMFHKKNQ